MLRRMSFPIFIDANVPIYAAGREHRLRSVCRQVISLAGSTPAAFFTNVEVLQEMLHGYLTRGWSDGRVLFREFSTLMAGRIQPVLAADLALGADLADRYGGLEARDLVHAAVMMRLGLNRLVSADRRFDTIPDLQRLDPQDVAVWAAPLP